MELLNEITNIIRLVGGGIAGFGLFQLIMSVKDQNPNAKSIAFTELGVGLVLISIAPKITQFIINYLPK